MSEIKLIALDLDGTLLNSKKRLSPKNEEALKLCIEKGIQVVPCTGRIWFAVPDFIREIPGIHYGITTNGAVLEDVIEGRVLDEHKLSSQLALELLEQAKDFHTMYDVYVGGKAFIEKRFLDRMDEFGVSPSLQAMICQTRTPVDDVLEQVRTLNVPAEKVNYFFGDMSERLRARNLLAERGDVVVSAATPRNLEINAVGATKGEAILRLVKHLGIKPEQTMGFGDGENDISMMRLAGVGVAMGNAEDFVKSEADYITLTNDEDGVAVALEKLGVL